MDVKSARIAEPYEALAIFGSSSKLISGPEPIRNPAIMIITSPDTSTSVKIEFVQADSLIP